MGAAVEREPQWAKEPLLRYWRGLALHYLGEPDAAIVVWLPLGWLAPDLLARQAPTLPNPTIREGWAAFERSGLVSLVDAVDHPAPWFPPWFLLRHRGLAHRFAVHEISETEVAAQVFQQLLTLLPLERGGLSDDVVRKRRALRDRHPAFFRYYLEVVGQRRPGR